MDPIHKPSRDPRSDLLTLFHNFVQLTRGFPSSLYNHQLTSLQKKLDTLAVLEFSKHNFKMAVISAATIITSLSLFHVTLAFFFLTNPQTIADQTLVFIIGEAMGLVLPPPSATLKLSNNFTAVHQILRRPISAPILPRSRLVHSRHHGPSLHLFPRGDLAVPLGLSRYIFPSSCLSHSPKS